MKKCRHHRAASWSRSRGLSLVESTVVMAVMGVVATAAVPAMNDVVDNRRIESLAVRLASDVQHARSHAVAHNQTVRLSVLRSCYVVHTGPASDCRCADALGDGDAVCEGSARLLTAKAWQSQDTVRVLGPAASLAFDPLLGTVTPTATLRVVGRHGHAVHQVVNVMGRLRSCSPHGAVPGYLAC